MMEQEIQERQTSRSYKRVVTDIIIWLVAIAACILWRWLDAKEEVWLYAASFGAMIVGWLLLGWMFHLYRPYKETSFRMALLSLVATAGAMIGVSYLVIYLLPWNLSFRVAV